MLLEEDRDYELRELVDDLAAAVNRVTTFDPPPYYDDTARLERYCRKLITDAEAELSQLDESDEDYDFDEFCLSLAAKRAQDVLDELAA